MMLLLVSVLFWTGPVAPAFAQTGTTPDTAEGEEGGIYITSDSLTANDAEQYAEFAGNVRAIQGNTVIVSDRLRIFYQDRNGSPEDGEVPGQGAVREIVASGNVRITFDDMVAEGEEAVYTTENRVLVISGPEARVTRDQTGTISGARIIVDRDDGKIRFEGGVEGMFFPGDRGLN